MSHLERLVAIAHQHCNEAWVDGSHCIVVTWYSQLHDDGSRSTHYVEERCRTMRELAAILGYDDYLT